jgi:hypothetical protein
MMSNGGLEMDLNQIVTCLNCLPKIIVCSIFVVFVIICVTLIRFIDSLSNRMFPPHIKYGKTKEFLKRIKYDNRKVDD